MHDRLLWMQRLLTSGVLAAGTINNVDPAVGPIIGQSRVTISGSSLGSGSDITSVLIKGVAAAIVSQTPSSVIVTTGAATQGQGDVEVHSVSFGSARLVNAYLYNDSTFTHTFRTWHISLLINVFVVCIYSVGAAAQLHLQRPAVCCAGRCGAR